MPDDDRERRSWNDDDRPSWRERDKMREKSSYRREEKPAFGSSKKEQAWARNAALRKAKEMFAKKKDPAQAAAEEALEQAKNTANFGEVARQFVDTYGLTDDWHVQLLLAQAPVSAIAGSALAALAEQADKLGVAEKRTIATQLRILMMTASSKTKQAVQAALDKF